MSAVYLETSALLTWLLGEPRAAEVMTTVDAADTIVTSVLTLVEVGRALVRAETGEMVTAADSQRLRGMLRRASAGWMLMEITAAVRERAGRPFPSEPVRLLDALHLATALEFSQAFPEIELLSFDRRILANAQSLGLGGE